MLIIDLSSDRFISPCTQLLMYSRVVGVYSITGAHLLDLRASQIHCYSQTTSWLRTIPFEIVLYDEIIMTIISHGDQKITRSFMDNISVPSIQKLHNTCAMHHSVCSQRGVGNCTSRLSWSSVRHGPRGTRLWRRCLLFGGARNGLTVQRAVRRARGLSGRVSGQIEISPLPRRPPLAQRTMPVARLRPLALHIHLSQNELYFLIFYKMLH